MKKKLPTSKKKLINKEEFEKSAKAAFDLCISCGEPVRWRGIVSLQDEADFLFNMDIQYCDNKECQRRGLLTAITS